MPPKDLPKGQNEQVADRRGSNCCCLEGRETRPMPNGAAKGSHRQFLVADPVLSRSGGCRCLRDRSILVCSGPPKERGGVLTVALRESLPVSEDERRSGDDDNRKPCERNQVENGTDG